MACSWEWPVARQLHTVVCKCVFVCVWLVCVTSKSPEHSKRSNKTDVRTCPMTRTPITAPVMSAPPSLRDSGGDLTVCRSVCVPESVERVCLRVRSKATKSSGNHGTLRCIELKKHNEPTGLKSTCEFVYMWQFCMCTWACDFIRARVPCGRQERSTACVTLSLQCSMCTWNRKWLPPRVVWKTRSYFYIYIHRMFIYSAGSRHCQHNSCVFYRLLTTLFASCRICFMPSQRPGVTIKTWHVTTTTPRTSIKSRTESTQPCIIHSTSCGVMIFFNDTFKEKGWSFPHLKWWLNLAKTLKSKTKNEDTFLIISGLMIYLNVCLTGTDLSALILSVDSLLFLSFVSECFNDSL